MTPTKLIALAKELLSGPPSDAKEFNRWCDNAITVASALETALAENERLQSSWAKAIVDTLMAENERLKAALSNLVANCPSTAESPPWATDEVRKQNQKQLNDALNQAAECFPLNYGNVTLDGGAK